MKTCSEIQERFVEALYGELTAAGREEFEIHLMGCARCAKQFEQMKATLRVMDDRERSEPGEDFWEDFGSRLQALATDDRSSQPSGPAVVPFSPRISTELPRRTDWHWAFRTAAAVALVAVGVLIGRLFLAPEIPQMAREATVPVVVDPVATANDELHTKVNDYVQRSRTLLLGIVNIDTEADGVEALDLDPQRRVSEGLIQDASYLKGNLDSNQHRRLLELIEDLEIVLLQIANLESRYNLDSVEVVKDGVERSSLLMKINLELVRPSPFHTKDPAKNPGA